MTLSVQIELLSSRSISLKPVRLPLSRSDIVGISLILNVFTYRRLIANLSTCCRQIHMLWQQFVRNLDAMLLSSCHKKYGPIIPAQSLTICCCCLRYYNIRCVLDINMPVQIKYLKMITINFLLILFWSIISFQN